MNKWIFAEPENFPVIISKKILFNKDYISYVSHDTEDGAWQFLNNQAYQLSENDASVVSLREVFEIDSSIMELSDLPKGWSASRTSKESKWIRSREL